MQFYEIRYAQGMLKSRTFELFIYIHRGDSVSQ